MSKEAKVVALIRKYSSAIDDAPNDLRAIEAAVQNLDTAHSAAEAYGLGELALAASLEHSLSSTAEREVAFDYLTDPVAFLKDAEALIEKHKEYLK